jgi:glycosyltransferase involved in cell wall biosynthesis
MTQTNSNSLMIVFYDMRLGGIQRKIIDIIQFYHRTNPHQKIYLCLCDRKGLFLEQVPPEVIILSPSKISPHLNLLRFSLWLIIQLVTIKPKYILTFMDFSAVATLFAKCLVFWQKTNVVIGEDILTSKHIQTERFPQLRLAMIRLFYPFAHRILVQTKIQKKDLETLIYRGKNNHQIVVSPNWLPLNFPPQNPPAFINRSTDILFVGRIDEQKNLPLFIDIIRNTVVHYPKLKVKIVGNGSQEPLIQGLIRQYRLDHTIKIIPTTINIHRYYQSAKIFLLTSHYEGFPLTIIEAISSGCISLSTDIPEVTQFFSKDKSKFIYQDCASAQKLILRYLSQGPNPSLLKYQNRVVSDQIPLLQSYLKQVTINS